MADSLTSIFSFTKPEVNVSTTWPTSLNVDLDSLDDLLARPKQTFNSPTVGATTTCDLSLARVFVFTVSQATTLSFTNPPTASFAVHVDLLVTNGSAFVLTFPASMSWVQGVAPTLQAAGFDRIRLISKDAGVTWYAYHVGKNLSLTGNLVIQGIAKSGAGTSTSQYKPTQALTTAGSGGTTATVEASLVAFSLPANTLTAIGDAVRVRIYGVASVQAAQIRVKFGATYVLNVAGGNNVGATNAFFGEVVIRRTGAATQTTNAILWVATAVTSNERAAPTHTLSGAVTIDVRVNASAGGCTAIVDSLTIECLAA